MQVKKYASGIIRQCKDVQCYSMARKLLWSLTVPGSWELPSLQGCMSQFFYNIILHNSFTILDQNENLKHFKTYCRIKSNHIICNIVSLSMSNSLLLVLYHLTDVTIFSCPSILTITGIVCILIYASSSILARRAWTFINVWINKNNIKSQYWVINLNWKKVLGRKNLSILPSP